jgi:hypothetical protein
MPSGILRLGDAARGGILEGVRLHQEKEQNLWQDVNKPRQKRRRHSTS